MIFDEAFRFGYEAMQYAAHRWNVGFREPEGSRNTVQMALVEQQTHQTREKITFPLVLGETNYC